MEEFLRESKRPLSFSTICTISGDNPFSGLLRNIVLIIVEFSVSAVLFSLKMVTSLFTIIITTKPIIIGIKMLEIKYGILFLFVEWC
ncbi:phosphatidylinositol kinase and protein kinases of the PI-3 kinase family [Candidatus Brocadia sinica JPN1]|uniref:Phosphatidylinositol kinase and protein kinases of the PI-3 kinase family n=1 Tax=Candidatus Brocadia sinica JPN1 TaxID=1197129 RepID=A0ABQ0K2Z2_9BACT|nr:phosphatidylinositol kinase and protein kinases of the PI-3 kinase family [Candidatus Brocadia sinica JPN1]GIK12325.1 MAG: hypothetical protein BroJett002_10320 [Candidatus Brocadia sinica]GJQ19441.1 MAG: hypothetical protein HBSIN01_34000 [Candidatus Brocadia sinica]